MRSSTPLFSLGFFLFTLFAFLLPSSQHSIAFNHGVASGDPLSDGVIIWTRVSGIDTPDIAKVRWLVSENADMSRSIQTGEVLTNAGVDYTVKIDLQDLQAASTYYYRFECEGVFSEIGRTRTLPKDSTAAVNLAVVSCSNYEWGYFNPLAALAKRDSVDAVLHLGDYIYEYQTSGYGDTTIGRIHDPLHEIISLEDYRKRYAQYRSTLGFLKVHQKHPFITIWDDHEITNNAYVEGAQNHQDNEGDYITRREAARQAYYEWMPVREYPAKTLYRNFSFGNLVDLIMLDERLAGRTAPVDSASDSHFQDSTRSILGSTQRDWLLDKLQDSKARWKVIGNQVLFSDLRLEKIFPKRPINLDAWDGYPYEKQKIIQFLQAEQMQNLIFVTGDTHCSWAFETPSSIADYQAKGAQSLVAVEFGTTSISSGNYDEYAAVDSVLLAEQVFLQSNPHLKYVNLRDHGYLLLRLRATEATAEWYYSESLRQPSDQERLGKRVRVMAGEKVLSAE